MSIELVVVVVVVEVVLAVRMVSDVSMCSEECSMRGVLLLAVVWLW